MLLYGQLPPDDHPPRAEEQTDLPLGPDRAERARVFVEDTLRDWGHGAVVDRAVLCTSELVTELAACDPDSVALVLRHDGDSVQVEVRLVGCDNRFHDLVTQQDTKRAASVEVIDRLATLWGVSPSGAGETIWFELTT